MTVVVAQPATRERILAAARDLFQQRGFHAVGLADILERAGAPKGSLYHHFPAGKDALGAAAVAGIAADVTAYIILRRTAGRSAIEIVAALAEMSAQRMEQERFGWSPLIAAVAHQTNAETPLLAAALAAAHGEWRRELAAALVVDGCPEPRAAVLSSTAVALLEGAVLVSRIEGDASSLRAVAGQIARLAVVDEARSLDVPDGAS